MTVVFDDSTSVPLIVFVLAAVGTLVALAWWWAENRRARYLEDANYQLRGEVAAALRDRDARAAHVCGEPGAAYTIRPGMIEADVIRAGGIVTVYLGKPSPGTVPDRPRHAKDRLSCGCTPDGYVRSHRPGFCPFNGGCDCGGDPRAHGPDTYLLRPPGEVAYPGRMSYHGDGE